LNSIEYQHIKVLRETRKQTGWRKKQLDGEEAEVDEETDTDQAARMPTFLKHLRTAVETD
jgi:hypothetical protein